MRVVFLSVLPPFRGGISRFGEHFIKALSKISDVIPLNYAVQYPKLLFPGKTQFLEPEPETLGKRVAHPTNPLQWIRTIQEIKRLEPAIFIYAYWHPFFSPMLWFICFWLRKNGIKTCGLFHNVIAHEKFPFQDFLLNGLVKQTDVAVTLSTSTRTELSQIGKMDVLELFHPVADLEAPLAKDVQKWQEVTTKKPVLTHLGLIRPYKGVDLLLKALDQIPNWWERCTVVFAGENYINEDVLFDGVSAKTRSNIQFVNRFLSDSEMTALLKETSVLILPYRTASQSGIMAQAIAAELPVICSRLDGLTQYISEGKTGWSFEPENVPALAETIRSYLKGEKMAAASILSDRKAGLSWERFASTLYSHLKA